MIGFQYVPAIGPHIHPWARATAAIPVHRAALDLAAIVVQGLYDLTVTGQHVSQACGVHHVEHPELPASQDEARTGDQERTRSAIVLVAVIEIRVIIGSEPVEQR